MPQIDIEEASKPARKSFKVWIKQFLKEDSPFGDLAGDIQSDSRISASQNESGFPNIKNDIAPAMARLSHKGACTAARQTLLEAWSAYCAETGTEDKTDYRRLAYDYGLEIEGVEPFEEDGEE